jgi:TRAP-type C4-dicarboxylate transport system permease small subunit
MKMKVTLNIVVTVLFAIVTFLLALTTIYRLAWDYSETGVHFDEESMTTYSDDAIIAYGTLTIVFFILTLTLLIRLFKRYTR